MVTHMLTKSQTKNMFANWNCKHPLPEKIGDVVRINFPFSTDPNQKMATFDRVDKHNFAMHFSDGSEVAPPAYSTSGKPKKDVKKIIKKVKAEKEKNGMKLFLTKRQSRNHERIAKEIKKGKKAKKRFAISREEILDYVDVVTKKGIRR